MIKLNEIAKLKHLNKGDVFRMPGNSQVLCFLGSIQSGCRCKVVGVMNGREAFEPVLGAVTDKLPHETKVMRIELVMRY